MLAGSVASGTQWVSSSVAAALLLAAWAFVALVGAVVDPQLPIACGIATVYHLLPTTVYPMFAGSSYAGVLGFVAIYLAIASAYVVLGWLAGRRRIRT